MSGASSTVVQRRYARIAGAAYIANYAAAVFGTVVPASITGSGTFSERAARALASESLYRVALATLSLSWVLIVVIAYALYVTLAPLDRRLAQIALFMETCQASIGAVTAMLSFGSLHLLTASASPESDAAIRGLINSAIQSSAGAGFQIAMMFLGVGSTIYFLLFYRGRYLPRLLAGWGVIASMIFFAVSILILTFPEQTRTLQLGWGPMGIAEVVTGFWLLFGRLKINDRLPDDTSTMEAA